MYDLSSIGLTNYLLGTVTALPSISQFKSHKTHGLTFLNYIKKQRYFEAFGRVLLSLDEKRVGFKEVRGKRDNPIDLFTNLEPRFQEIREFYEVQKRGCSEIVKGSVGQERFNATEKCVRMSVCPNVCLCACVYVCVCLSGRPFLCRNFEEKGAEWKILCQKSLLTSPRTCAAFQLATKLPIIAIN